MNSINDLIKETSEQDKRIQLLQKKVKEQSVREEKRAFHRIIKEQIGIDPKLQLAN